MKTKAKILLAVLAAVLCLEVAVLVLQAVPQHGKVSDVSTSPGIPESPVPSAAAVSPEPTAVPPGPTAVPGMLVSFPEGYVQGGTLPVYAAVERDFTAAADPSWFNQSDVVRQEGRTLFFADSGQLHINRASILYNTYDGTYEAFSLPVNGHVSSEILARPTLASQANTLAAQMLSGFPVTRETYHLENTELTRITLSEAQAAAEQLMQLLGMEGYTCTAAIDMSIRRITQMGGKLNQLIDSGAFWTNAPRYDYSLAAPADEGFHLQYHKYGTSGDLAAEHSAVFYVTADGIMFADLWERYCPGEVLSIAGNLLSAEDAAMLLPEALASSRWPETLQSITHAALTWMPCNEDGTMVMRPIWMLVYLTEESIRKGYSGSWAAFDAVTGELRAAIFK